METQETTPKQDKQVTIDVPEDRLAEFYAFYSRFLAIGPERRRRGGRGEGGHQRGGHGRGGHGCRPREAAFAAEEGSDPTQAPPASAAGAPQSEA